MKNNEMKNYMTKAGAALAVAVIASATFGLEVGAEEVDPSALAPVDNGTQQTAPETPEVPTTPSTDIKDVAPAETPDANPDDANPDDANPGDANPGDANPDDANPGDANPDDANPNDANPDDANPTGSSQELLVNPQLEYDPDSNTANLTSDGKLTVTEGETEVTEGEEETTEETDVGISGEIADEEEGKLPNPPAVDSEEDLENLQNEGEGDDKGWTLGDQKDTPPNTTQDGNKTTTTTTTTYTLTKTETNTEDKPLTQEELGKVLGVSLTATDKANVFTYTETDANGNPVTVTVTVEADNSTETTTSNSKLVVEKTTTETTGPKQVEKDVTKQVPEIVEGAPVTGSKETQAQTGTESKQETADAITAAMALIPEGTEGITEGDTTTYQFTSGNTSYTITETRQDTAGKTLDDMQPAEVLALLGDGFSYNEEEGKYYHGDTEATVTVDIDGKLITRTMTTVENVASETADADKEEATQTATNNAVIQALADAGIANPDPTKIQKNKDGTYSYSDEKDGKTYTYTFTVATEAGAPVEKDGKGTVTVTATVTAGSETIYTEGDIENTLFANGPVDGKVAADAIDWNGNVGTATVTGEDGKTYTYTFTVTNTLDDADTAAVQALMGGEYSTEKMQKITWTVTETTETPATDFEHQVTKTGNFVDNNNGTFTITFADGTKAIVENVQGNTYKDTAEGSKKTYTITAVPYTEAEIRTMIVAKYPNLTIDTVTYNETTKQYTITGKEGNKEVTLTEVGGISSYTVVESGTVNDPVDATEIAVGTTPEELNAEKLAKRDMLIGQVAAAIMESGADYVILLGEEIEITADNEKDIKEQLWQALDEVPDTDWYTWIEANTVINPEALEGTEALEELLTKIGDTAKTTVYDFTSYFGYKYNGENWKLNGVSGKTDAQKAADAEQKANQAGSVNIDGKVYAAYEKSNNRWYYRDANNQEVEVDEDLVYDTFSPNYMPVVGHLDLGIDGTVKVENQAGVWESTEGVIIPDSENGIQIFWGDTAADIVNGNGDGCAEQEKDRYGKPKKGIVQDNNTGMYEYEVHKNSPTSSQYYRVEATFAYDVVKDANGNAINYDGQNLNNLKKQNPTWTFVTLDNDTVHAYRENAPLRAYGFMTQEANTCGNKLPTSSNKNGYDLTLSELTLSKGTVYAGGLGTVNLSLQYTLGTNERTENVGGTNLSGKIATDETNKDARNGVGYQGSYDNTENKDLTVDAGSSAEYTAYTQETTNYEQTQRTDFEAGTVGYSYKTFETIYKTVTETVTETVEETTTTTTWSTNADASQLSIEALRNVDVKLSIVKTLPGQTVEERIAPPTGGEIVWRNGLGRAAAAMVNDPEALIIPDEEVPLAAAKKTGDLSALFAGFSLISLSGAYLASRKERRNKREK